MEALQKLYDNRKALYESRMKRHVLADRYLNWETEFKKLAELIGNIVNNKKIPFVHSQATI